MRTTVRAALRRLIRAELAGIKARRAGKPMVENPHPKRKQAHEVWRGGWMNAHFVIEARRHLDV